MDLGLAGKVVIVTGGTANIGRATVLAFAAEHAQIVIVGRDEQAGARVTQAAREAGAAASVFVASDMLEPAASGKVITIAEELGPPLVLVNNIGGNVAAGLFVDSDPATWAGDIDLNLGTTLRMTHAALPGMRDRRAGRIINVGSTAGLVGDYMLPVYSAAKAAVHGFTKVLAKEVGEFGITVNCVAPYGTISDDPDAYSSGSRWHPEKGFIAKSFRTDDPAVLAKRSRRGVLARGIGRADEVAAAILYLASDQAGGFVTGQILQVDGGTLL